MFKIPIQISRDIKIQKDAETLKKIISDFNTWPKWSPWLAIDEKAQVKISGTPHFKNHKQEWNGEAIGTGEITLENTSANELMYDLNFFKPFKSHAKAIYKITTEGDSVNINWRMDTGLPFFLFFFKKMMIAHLNMDFDRGLKRLKDYSEKGVVHSKLINEGIQDKKETHFIGLKRKTNITEIAKVLNEDFAIIMKDIEEKKLPVPEFMFVQYPKLDPITGDLEYIASLGFHYLTDLPELAGYKKGIIPAHKCIEVKHFGPYYHIANAWALASNHMRRNKLNFDKSIPMYEVYLNNPKYVEEKDIQTAIHLPVF